MRLDLGCGASKKEGFLGVDNLDLAGVDIKHDLNYFPYPFESGSVEEVWMDQVLEHLESPMKVVEEIHRICAEGAKVNIGVPYFRSFYSVIDPTHVNFFGVHWFDYFDPGSPLNQRYQYSSAKYKIDKIEFDREFVGSRIGLFHRLMIRLANKKRDFYEAKLSHLYPLNSLTFYLSVLKH